MEFAQLGRSGLSVSRIVLGTLNFGPETSEPDAHVLMDRAHEHGINFFDTSNVYGWKRGEGWTEQIIGRWFAQGGGRRERTVLATKVYNAMSDWPNDGRLSALHIRQSCDASLRRLQTDHIDVFTMHHVDRNTPWEEIWEAMEVLRFQGKILYVGSSNFAGWHIAKAQEAAKARHFLGLVSEQSIYNLLTRDIELEVLPAARDYGVAVLAWSPLLRGLLSGVLRQEREGTRYPAEQLEQHRPALEKYESLCDEIGEHPAEVAIAWLLTQPGLTGPVIGPRDAEHLDSAVRALEVSLDDEVLARLDDIFPGRLPAPEHYTGW
jgi:NDP-hexose C3-ketoreductase / dTDP-4-oxo-2-deoxy-alpha-D-pentos-2-ene 2,3-reductase